MNFDTHPYGYLTSHGNEGKEFNECYTARMYVHLHLYNTILASN